MIDWDKIERLRQKLGLTVDAAAGKADMSKQQWSANVKAGRDAKVSTLVKISHALGCDYRDLLKPPALRKRGGK